MTLGVVVFGAILAGVVYGSDARVIGIGNSANTFGADEPTPKLAKLIMSLDAAPEISEEVLTGVYEAVAEKAKAGDLEAATVLFDLAAMQREARENEKQVALLN
jgi:hypothetical protein